ncbi:hypothetical protein Tco_1285882 [Tanacetum coccineum]
MGGMLKKDPAPHLTAHQEQTVKLLKSNKAPFRHYPECFLCLVGLSLYYPFNENTYPTFERPDGMEMGLLDFIKTADPRKVQAVKVQKNNDQVKLLESMSHCFMPLVTPVAGGSSSAAAPKVSAPAEVELENPVLEDTYLDLTEPDADLAATRPEELRKDHPNLATGTGGKTLVGLRQLMSTSPFVLRPSFQADIQGHVAVQSARTADIPVYIAAATVTSARENVGVTSTSRAEHELELKEKLKGKYDARSRLLEEKDLEILRLKSLLAEEAERAERAKTPDVVRFRDQVSVLTAEVSALKITIAQKDTDISLLDSRATHLKSALDDSQASCAEVGSLITSLTSDRDRLTSEVLYNCVAELEAHVMDISGRLEGELYPAYLTTLAGRRWFLTHGIQLAVLKCFKSSEYQGILGHALGHAVDFVMQEGLRVGYEHGVAGTSLSVVEAYNPEAARTSYLDAVRALKNVDFPMVNLLKSKKDVGMDELSVPIHHSDDKAIVGETSLTFALLNVHSRAEGARKHVTALRQLMMEIVSNPLSSQT